MGGHYKHKALVAEDDRALADIIRLSLDRLGLDVSVAHDGQRALTLARDSAFDLIVTDYQMPKLDGEQLLREVRSGTASSHAQMILCSAKSYEIDCEQLKKDLDLVGIFFKPFSLNELKMLIQELRFCESAEPKASSNSTETANAAPVIGASSVVGAKSASVTLS
jgi:DNA-binding response OmpR family regulator